MKKWIQTLCLFLCCILVWGNAVPVSASDAEQKTVRVGFFSSDGYHETNADGSMQGYGFDFLQMMLRYNDWDYEYIGYDKNWGDMLTMLDNGDIDMVTLANKTPDRERKYDYSEKAIGTSSTIMTISAENDSIIPGDYATYDGAVIGLVGGSSHNSKFEEYAREHGFTYTTKYYEDIEELLADLRNGVNINIAVTSNMRQVQNEVILDEFNATEYYAIVKKGNESLLDEINSGINQLDVYSPDWRNTLFKKYYSDINSTVISFSVEEREYLQQLKDENTVLKVTMNPELKPYSYFENGEAKGIAPTIFAEIANRLGISYEILPSADRWEYKNQLNTGQADIDLTAYLDYSQAQKYNLKETDAYINSTMAMLTRKGNSVDTENMTIAIMRDPTEYIGYNSSLITPYTTKEYESMQACVQAVKKGEVDATFCYVYVAEQAVTADFTNNLQYSIMQDYPFSLSLGVINIIDHRLLSVLNKGVNSISSSYIQGVMLRESTAGSQNESILAFAYDHPFIILAIACVFLFALFMGIILAIRSRNHKNELMASREVERFIGYVCESYELVVEIDLRAKQRTIYRMEDNVLRQEQKKHTPFDQTFFQSCVQAPDVDFMTEAFSDASIDQMIAEGGSHRYLECQLKNKQGGYDWYSYIIKAVPKDEKHPRNFVVFKKNIQEIKMEEEEQKQLLREALERAKSASTAKGQFLSRMSHEIRTPLNAVIGYMEIAKDSKDNVDKMMHCVENSDVAAKHLLSIINDVLDISSIESGKMKVGYEEFDLKSQLSSISTMFFNQAKEKEVRFEVALENVAEEWVIGDSLRLNQILMNLLSNAVKFTPKDGKVSLRVSQVNVDEKQVYMKFCVSDTGIGMSEEYKERLFHPFEQESAVTAQKYGGTGLGLSITYNLIQLMGGSIDVKSTQGEGTTFLVSLHFGRSTKVHVKQALQDYSHVRALIVDDDKDACTYMKQLLKRCKVKCDTVNDGESALKQLRRRQGSEYRYDMCIMDWNMPGMNGIDTARKMREEFGTDLPIIIATAYDVTEFSDVAKTVGVDKVIAKPLFQSTMFDLLVTTYGKYEPVQTKEENQESMQGMHVLLAEDNPMNMEIAVEILHKAGLTVDGVTDGKQAVERFEKEPEGTYDAILMDVQMPVMDGYQATAAIRKLNHPEAASVPIIAMTANAFAEDVNAALACGMNNHIAKPVDYGKLYEVLHACKRKKEHEQE